MQASLAPPWATKVGEEPPPAVVVVKRRGFSVRLAIGETGFGAQGGEIGITLDDGGDPHRMFCLID